MILIGILDYKRSISISGGSTLLNGIVGYWKLNESSGNAIDSVNGNNGTVTDAHQNEPGKIGTSYLFDQNYPVTELVDCGNPAVLCLTTAGTISIWIFPTIINGANMMVCKGNWDTDTDGYILTFYSDSVRFELGHGGTKGGWGSGFGTVVTSKWQHIVASWDTNANNLKLYIDNVIKLSIGNLITSDSSSHIFSIGSEPIVHANGHGYMDEVGVWNRQLTDDEVTELYSFGVGKTYPFSSGGGSSTLSEKIITYWKFDDNSTNAIDSTGNMHTATGVNIIDGSVGKLGNSFYFDGTAQCEFERIFPTDTSIWSMGGWIHRDVTTNGYETVCAYQGSYGLWLYNNKIDYYIDSADHLSDIDIPIGEWFHVLITSGVNGMNFYLNNASCGSFDTHPYSNWYRIGGHGSEYFKGNIDEWAIWDKELTYDERTELYNVGLGLTYPFNIE
jgi:hypothetical protein